MSGAVPSPPRTPQTRVSPVKFREQKLNTDWSHYGITAHHGPHGDAVKQVKTDHPGYRDRQRQAGQQMWMKTSETRQKQEQKMDYTVQDQIHRERLNSFLVAHDSIHHDFKVKQISFLQDKRDKSLQHWKAIERKKSKDIKEDTKKEREDRIRVQLEEKEKAQLRKLEEEAKKSMWQANLTREEQAAAAQKEEERQDMVMYDETMTGRKKKVLQEEFEHLEAAKKRAAARREKDIEANMSLNADEERLRSVATVDNRNLEQRRVAIEKRNKILGEMQLQKSAQERQKVIVNRDQDAYHRKRMAELERAKHDAMEAAWKASTDLPPLLLRQPKVTRRPHSEPHNTNSNLMGSTF